MNRKVIPGKLYGKWLTLYTITFGPRSRRESRWICQCECGIEKAINSFDLLSGLSTQCSKCYTHNRLRPLEGRFNKLKNHTKKKFSLSYEDYIALSGEPCHYCDSPLNWDPYWSSLGVASNLDRMDCAKGYEKNNIVPCCATCNTAKNSNFTYQEFLLLGPIINKIIKRRKKL